MTLELNIEDRAWDAVPLERLADAAIGATLDRLGLDPSVWEVSLLATGDRRIAGLNGSFRDKPQPTNVLSWPSEERGAAVAGETPLPPDPADPELGDIALAWETIEREARDMDKPMADHVTHLIVHGLLHLLGYDHERDADATLMEGLESEILGKMGLPDPYAV
jgi:probable rRNA maturation factor